MTDGLTVGHAVCSTYLVNNQFYIVCGGSGIEKYSHKHSNNNKKKIPKLYFKFRPPFGLCYKTIWRSFVTKQQKVNRRKHHFKFWKRLQKICTETHTQRAERTTLYLFDFVVILLWFFRIYFILLSLSRPTEWNRLSN